MASSLAGRKRILSKYTAEEQALNKIGREAEDRLTRRRQARAEARVIRIRELEKQQEAADDESDRQYRKLVGDDPKRVYGNLRGSVTPSHSTSSMRKSSKDNSPGSRKGSLDLQAEMNALKDKFERAMLLYSQIDNEKSALLYEAELLREQVGDIEETFRQSQRECRNLTTETKMLKRKIETLELDKKFLQHEIQRRDELIEEAGLVLVYAEGSESGQLPSTASTSSANKEGTPDDGSSVSSGPSSTKGKFTATSMHCTQQTLHALDRVVPDGAELDGKIRQLVSEFKSMRIELEDARTQLSDNQARRAKENGDIAVLQNGADLFDFQQKDSLKQMAEVRFKLQECERENTNLQGSVIRLESQMKRFKQSAEQSEKENAEMKQVNRLLKKELREKENQLDESQETSKHLQQRLEKMRQTRRQVQ